MKKKITFLLLTMSAILFYSCGSVPLSQGPSYNNPTYDVSYLFEHEGVKVFRFYDRGNYVYFTQPTHDVYSVKDDSTRTSVQTMSSHENNRFDLNNKLDSSRIYDIEGISTEGTQAEVYYSNSKIKKAKIGIYGETGKIEMAYFFHDSYIDVTETVYSYKKIIHEINSEDDIHREYELRYQIDYNGKRLEVNRSIKHTDIFKEFKEVVPFEI